MEPLKPCPFCGSTDYAFTLSVGKWVVTCGNCECDGPWLPHDGKTHEQAIHAWNTRSAENDGTNEN